MSRTNRLLTVDEIENRFDIIDVISKYTSLKRKGTYYLGTCPFHNEKHSSFSVKGFHWECYACGKKGTGIINFIKEIENLSFIDTLKYFTNNITFKPKTNKNIITKPKIIESIDIEFVDCDFTPAHLEYWKNFNMDQKWLNSKNVFAVKEWAMGSKNNLRKIKPTYDEITFAYYAEDIKKCKILRIGPEITPKDKWRNSCPNDYLWYYNDYVNDQCDLGFTVKSVKDCLILQKLNRCSIATNNESDVILLENNVGKINNIFKKNVMCYGTDADGKMKSINITKNTGWSWFNIQNNLYEQYNIEDFADFLNSGFSYKQLERLLLNKNL